MNSKKMHIHMLGICGTGMTSLAQLFKEAGHSVTGSDQNIYPPMSTQLEALGIDVEEGYKPEHLSNKPDLVIVGNVITKQNPEAQEMMRLGLPYRSMPQALSEFFLGERTPIVIAGTHGKTTLSTLTAWLLQTAGEEPGFFIGGIGRNFKSGSHAGRGPFFVIEGDEYDTAFFDKGPKFLHYKPHVVMLTSIEFDHADIYKNIDHLMNSFRNLVRLLPHDGLLIACNEYETVQAIAKEAKCRVIYYGLDKGDYHAENLSTTNAYSEFSLLGPNTNHSFRCPLFGNHNMQNVIAATALLIESGIPSETVQKGLDSFLGIARRQDLIGEAGGITIIDDFAHHPTAVRETIEAMHMRYPKKRLIAIFEPRSNTSRRNIFHQEFVEAFAGADRAIIASVHQPEKIPAPERLDVARLAEDLMRSGVDAHYIPNTEHILEFVLRGVNSGDLILVMSNGDFDGLAKKLLQGIKKLCK